MDLVKKNNGVTAIEASLTFSIVFCLIFFMIEIFRMSDTQSAMDSSVIEMSFDFMGSKNTNKFQQIIDAHRPSYIPANDISWYFIMYDDISKISDEEIFWPNETGSSSNEYVDINKDASFLSRGSGSITLKDYKRPEYNANVSLGGKAFVLTIVCDYKFASGFIGKFFNGGSNTINNSKFLVWSRSVGICH
jgi:hypothetical protein